MKVTELKSILQNQYDQEQLIHLAVEMYKIIPKAKKEHHEIDVLICNPLIKEVEKAKKQAIAKGEIDWQEEAKAIDQFIEYARLKYFFGKNSFVTPKEQSNWRFTVRRWVKDLSNPKALKIEPELKGELLYKLYMMIMEDYDKRYFPGEDPIRSIGIPQEVFYKQMLQLLSTQNRKEEFLERGLNAIIDYTISDECGFESLTAVLSEACIALHLTEAMFELIAVKMRRLNTPDPADRRARGRDDFYKNQKIKRLTEMGFNLFVVLEDYDAAISFFNTHFVFYHNDTEIKLYVLVSKIVHYKLPSHYATEQINNYITMGVKPRASTMKVYDTVSRTGKLPDYF
jgi:hypothetical protein